MKNVQVIDGAENSTYSIYEFTDEQFLKIFPDPGQDIEFLEDAEKKTWKEGNGKCIGWSLEAHCKQT